MTRDVSQETCPNKSLPWLCEGLEFHFFFSLTVKIGPLLKIQTTLEGVILLKQMCVYGILSEALIQEQVLWHEI